MPAVVPDIDIDDNQHGHIVYPSQQPPPMSTVTLAEAQTGKHLKDADAEKGLQKYEIVDWEDEDPENPRNFSVAKKWSVFLLYWQQFLSSG